MPSWSEAATLYKNYLHLGSWAHDQLSRSSVPQASKAEPGQPGCCRYSPLLRILTAQFIFSNHSPSYSQPAEEDRKHTVHISWPEFPLKKSYHSQFNSDFVYIMNSLGTKLETGVLYHQYVGRQQRSLHTTKRARLQHKQEEKHYYLLAW